MVDNYLSILLAGVVIILLFIWIHIFLRRYLSIVFAGFVVRLFIIFLHEETRFFGDDDVTDYLRYLQEFYDVWHQDLINYLKPHVPVYTILYPGWIFNVLGEQGLWVIRIANSALGVAVILPLNWINNTIFGKKLSQSQALLVILWPSWIRYTVELGRASPSVFFVLLGISGFIYVLNHYKDIRKLPIPFSSMIGMFLAVSLRIHYIAYFIPLFGLALLSQVRKSKISPYIKPIFYFIGILAMLISTIFFIKVYEELSQYRTTHSVLDSPEEALAYAENREEGDSAYLRGIYPQTPLDLLWYLPLHAFYFMFSPMIWNVHKPFSLGSAIQALFVLFLCFKAWYASRKVAFIKNNQSLLLLLTSIVFVAIIFGAVTKNAGGAERWRLPSTLVLLTSATSINKSYKELRGLHNSKQHNYS